MSHLKNCRNTRLWVDGDIAYMISMQVGGKAAYACKLSAPGTACRVVVLDNGAPAAFLNAMGPVGLRGVYE